MELDPEKEMKKKNEMGKPFYLLFWFSSQAT